MNTHDTQDGRPAILLTVLMMHLVAVLWVVRSTHQTNFSTNNYKQPLILLLLRDKSRADGGAPTIQVGPAARRPTTHGAPPPERSLPPHDTLMSSLEPLSKADVDWEREAALAVQNYVAGAEAEAKYRNLSGLSAAQLAWVRQNRFEPAPPGIPWQHPRVEIQNGIPIIWINDHCVVIPVMLAAFCAIGHIEARGDLFEHMRDPRGR